MALSLVSSPDKVALSKNPVVFELSTNNLFSIGGAISRHTWSFSALPINGDDANLSWLNGGVDLDLEFVTVPDNSGLQLPVGSGTVTSYLTNTLIPALRLNYYINRDFEISQSGTSIFLDARVKSPDYDILFTSGNVNYSFTKSQSGVLPVERPNFRIILTLYSKYRGSSDWDLVEMYKVPIDNKVVFDLAPYLSTYDSLLLPNVDLDSVLTAESQMIEYKVEYAEAFGSPTSVQKLISQSSLYALNAGFSERDREGYSFYDDWAPDFLTFNFTKTISVDIPVYLGFLNTTIYTSFWVVVKVFDTDGLISENVRETFTCSTDSLRIIPASYEYVINGIDLDGRTPTRYEVQVQRASTTQVIGKKAQFKIDLDPKLETVAIAYRNSFGILETLLFKGQVDQYRSVESFIASLESRYDSSYIQKRVKTFNLLSKEFFILRSGFLNQSEVYNLQEFLNSSEKYLISSGEYIPFYTENLNDIQVYKTKNYGLNSMEISAYLRPDKNFSHVKNRII